MTKLKQFNAAQYTSSDGTDCVAVYNTEIDLTVRNTQGAYAHLFRRSDWLESGGKLNDGECAVTYNVRIPEGVTTYVSKQVNAEIIAESAADAILAMVIRDKNGVPHYRTANDVPQKMPRKVQQKVESFFDWAAKLQKEEKQCKVE